MGFDGATVLGPVFIEIRVPTVIAAVTTAVTSGAGDGYRSVHCMGGVIVVTLIFLVSVIVVILVMMIMGVMILMLVVVVIRIIMMPLLLVGSWEIVGIVGVLGASVIACVVVLAFAWFAVVRLAKRLFYSASLGSALERRFSWYSLARVQPSANSSSSLARIALLSCAG